METIVDCSDPLNPLTYTGPCIAEHKSQLQRWKLLHTDEGEMLFIDDQLQSCSTDEAMYHEWLIHPAIAGTMRKKRVLILGGAEGCGLREVLKWDDVEHITQVDWDASLVNYFKGRADWNKNAYEEYRVRVVIEDVMKWLPEHYELYDCIFIDLLDPHATHLDWFRELLIHSKNHLTVGGTLVMNAGVVRKQEPTLACTLTSIFHEIWDESVAFTAFHVQVPSFQDEWGFFMVSSKQWSSVLASSVLPGRLKHVSKESIIGAVQWSEYPEELQGFWRGGVKKLASSPILERVEIGEHYGC